jgi:hypothetical protein
MSTQRYVGQVKFYNSADNKRFGFILAKDKDDEEGEIFFHLNDYRPPLMRDDGSIYFDRFGRAPRVPAVGDRIVFEATRGDRGYKASPWAFAEEYERLEAQAKKVIAANSVVCRVMQRYDVGGTKGEWEVKFEGNVAELNRLHPRPSNWNHDELRGSFSCSDFDYYIRFERKNGETWVECDDPRKELEDHEYRRVKRGY